MQYYGLAVMPVSLYSVLCMGMLEVCNAGTGVVFFSLILTCNAYLAHLSHQILHRNLPMTLLVFEILHLLDEILRFGFQHHFAFLFLYPNIFLLYGPLPLLFFFWVSLWTKLVHFGGGVLDTRSSVRCLSGDYSHCCCCWCWWCSC